MHALYVSGRRMTIGAASMNVFGNIDYGELIQPEGEFVPELPAPRRSRPHANPFHAKSAELHRPVGPHQRNFSDCGSERTESVADEYREAERAEKEAAAIRAVFNSPIQPPVKRKADQISSADPENLVWDESLRRQVEEDEMAGRGRGRGRPGGLQGATWEYDATIKLESKPTDLFPVRMPPIDLIQF